MLLVNLIILAIIVIALVVMMVILVRKFPELRQVDTESLPARKASETKERIIRAKLERNFLAKIKQKTNQARPVINKIYGLSKNLFEKVIELERQYRRQLAKKTVVEQEKIDEETESLVESGLELLGQDDFGAAERKFIDAIALDPKDQGAYRGLGELYWEQGKLNEAKETFEYLLKLNADNYDAYSHLGNIARSQKDLEKARDYHLKSIELDSAAALHYLDLAAVYEEMGQNDSAFDALQKAVGLDPNNPKNLDAMLDLSIIMGKKKEAKETLERLREVNPENQKISVFEEKIKKIGKKAKEETTEV